MLVIVSDIHLTDGSSGETIDPGAFDKFTTYLAQMAEHAKARDVEVVLLGDVFDVIRSETWLGTSIRPWSGPADVDGTSCHRDDHARAITEAILTREDNVACRQALMALREELGDKGIEVGYTFVPGNHDRLINHCPEARMAVAQWLGQDPRRWRDEMFPTSIRRRDYGVVARHGDCHDQFNFDGDDAVSCLGDAIVIDLLNRFPRDVEQAIGEHTDPDLVRSLREIDNVRPLLNVPVWVDAVVRRAREDSTRRQVQEVWHDLASDFLKLDFVRAHDRPLLRDPIDALQAGLWIGKHLDLGLMARLAEGIATKVLDHRDEDVRYPKRARDESALGQPEMRYVVYGHTHHHTIVPLDVRGAGAAEQPRLYLNSGTWRRVHCRTQVDEAHRDFASWHVMSFLTFYRDGERSKQRDGRTRNHSFEVWSGALG